LVISDIQFLKTLPKREIICGYGEILKHSLIADKKIFDYLNRNCEKVLSLTSPFIEKTIYESCKIKKDVVEKDEKEKGLRKTLNFGHTFAHAYEASLGYSKRLNHGEAVILGMKTALNFSFKNNLLNKKEHNLIINHISNSNLPSKMNKFFNLKDLNKILSFMLKDKKNNSDKISLVLLKKIGSPLINKEYNKKRVANFLKTELSD
jgi:3-dehydroquinate synthase/shikimate kinase/3-dehydroquinate synthase